MSKPRRGHGEGALYQRKSGDKRWVGSFVIVEGGRKKRKYVYGDTKVEARDKLKKAQRAYEQRQLVTGKSPTLASYLTFWLEVRHDFKPNTAHSFAQRIRQYILPHLGHLKLDQLTPDIIAAWITTLLKRGGAKGKGLGPNTVRYVHGILSNALNDAVRWEKIATNPMSRVKQPRYEEYDGEVLTLEQAGQLLRTAKDSRLECLLIIALITGMRKGEVLGLRWNDVDFEAKMLTVSHTLCYVPDPVTKKYRHILVEPKSKAGRRPIALPDIIIDALRDHRRRQLEQKMAARDKWQDLHLVFCGSLGNYYHFSVLRDQFKRLLRQAELPNIRFHDLRHSAATILLKLGVHPKVVQELLGHSNIAITLQVYSKVLPSIQRETMNVLNTAFQGYVKGSSG